MGALFTRRRVNASPGAEHPPGDGVVVRQSSLPRVAGHLVWIDCEMTGLDLGADALIEIATLVTDDELGIVDEGLDLVIHAEDDTLSAMPEVVADMHARSGLTDEVRASTLSVGEAEAEVLDYVKKWVPEPRTAPLCGNSIATDRGFLARDMPELDDHLHYRMIDVSSIKELCRRWYPRIYFGQPPKGLAHRALSDIRESIAELGFYRRTAFVASPGPTVEDIKAVADELGVTREPESGDG
jgi:oligoribonuclease